MKSLTFRQLSEEEEISKAFSLYPDDWKELLLPAWPDYAGTAGVYALWQEEGIATLGILFFKDAPEMDAFAKTASRLFSEGKPYIGFLYTLPQFRGKGFASLWIQEVKKLHPERSFWLTVEDPDLITFYKNNAFTLLEKSPMQDEWLLLSGPGSL